MSLRILSTTFVLLFTGLAGAQAASPIGLWAQYDDRTGEKRSLVEIYAIEGEKLEGKIVEIFDAPEPDPVCVACPEDDPRHNQPIKGLVLLTDLEAEGKKNTWKGEILDPEEGKIYRARIWVDESDSALRVRGYVGMFYRTQIWQPEG